MTDNNQLKEDILQEFSNIIRNLCKKYFIAGGTEEDLFQEGVIGLIQAFKFFGDDADYKSNAFKSFAIICIKRRIFDAIKKANKQNNIPLNTYQPLLRTNVDNQEWESIEVTVMVDSTNPEEIFIDKEDFYERIEYCKSKLTAYEMQVLNLYISGRKQKEIAQILNKSVKSIDNTLQRIKKKIK